MQVTVESGLWTLLVRHARAALPREACGLLGVGDADRDQVHIFHFVPTQNTADGLDRFAMDPTEVVRAEVSLRAAGLRLGATFHSHPQGPSIPSDTDQESCWPGLIHMIMGLGTNPEDSRLTAWKHTAGVLTQVPLRRLPSPTSMVPPSS